MIASVGPWAGELIEAAAYESLYAAAPPDLHDGAGASTQRFGHVVARVLEPLRDVPMLNGIMGVGAGDMDPSEELALVDAALVWLRDLEADGYVAVAPGTEIEEALTSSRGMEAGYPWMKFFRDLSAVVDTRPTDLRIIEANADEAHAFGTAFSEGFELPPFGALFGAAPVGVAGWHCMLALEGDEPAASGALYVNGDVCWLGLGGTRPAYRRRGAQSALLAARLSLAQELGCKVAYTETGKRVPERSSNSYRNILRAGFEEAYLRPNLVIAA